MPAMGLAYILMLLIAAGTFFLVFVVIPLLVMVFAQTERTIRVARRIFIVSLVIVAVVVLLLGYNAYTSGARSKAYADKLKSYVPTELRGKVPADFYTYAGGYDFWRFPLVWPYEIACYESEPVLQEYRGDKLLYCITHLAFDPNVLVAGNSSGWIVFDFESGEYETYGSEAEALDEAKRRGFPSDVVPEKLRTHYKRFIGARK